MLDFFHFSNFPFPFFFSFQYFKFSWFFLKKKKKKNFFFLTLQRFKFFQLVVNWKILIIELYHLISKNQN